MSVQRETLASINFSKGNINISEKVLEPSIRPDMKAACRRDILSLRFNQEQNLFACSMDTGLKIFNVDPLAVKATLGIVLRVILRSVC